MNATFKLLERERGRRFLDDDGGRMGETVFSLSLESDSIRSKDSFWQILCAIIELSAPDKSNNGTAWK